MIEGSKVSRPKLVGNFIRQKREAAGLSQRALGLLFSPPVTTQFISNLERGVTPLPLNHIPTLVKALHVSEAEIMSLLEQEYTLKLSGRLARMEGSTITLSDHAHTIHTGSPNGSVTLRLSASTDPSSVVVNGDDLEFMKSLYDAYRNADLQTKSAFASACESLLRIARR